MLRAEKRWSQEEIGFARSFAPLASLIWSKEPSRALCHKERRALFDKVAAMLAEVRNG